MTGSGRLILAEDGEIVFSSDEARVRVEGGEVCRKHGCGDFATVGTMADEGVYQTWCLERLSGGVRNISSGQNVDASQDDDQCGEAKSVMRQTV